MISRQPQEMDVEASDGGNGQRPVDYPYFGFPSDEACTDLHASMQRTRRSIDHTYPVRMRVTLVGLVLILLMVVMGQVLVFDRPRELQPALDDIVLNTVSDAELNYYGTMRGQETSKLPKGTQAKAVGRYGRHFMVETPSEERGTLRPSSIDAFFDVVLLGGAPLYSSEMGGATKGTVPLDSPMSGRNITPREELSKLRYRIRLEDGSVVYVNQGHVVSKLHELGIPTFGRSQKRVIHLDELQRTLEGKKMPDVLARLGAPVGVRNIGDHGGQQLIFSNVQALEGGMRYSGVTVEMADDLVRGVSIIGEPKRHVADGSVLSSFFHRLGVANLFVQLGWYGWWSSLSIYDALEEWWRPAALLFWLLSFLLTVAFALYLTVSFVSLPVFVAAKVSILLGRITPLPNVFLVYSAYVVLGLLGYGFYYFSMAFLGFGASRWITISYALVLGYAYILMLANLIGYIDATRCKDCRNLGRVRSLGSVFVGKLKHVEREKAIVGSKTAGNVTTLYWVWRPVVTYFYEYEDFAGCRRCGKSWSWSEVLGWPRRDMKH